MADSTPTLLPLGDAALLIRFAGRLDAEANAAAVGLARRLKRNPPSGAVEIVSNLVSVLVRYDPNETRFGDLAGQVRLALAGAGAMERERPARHTIHIRFGGEAGPDLAGIAETLGLSREAFIKAHNARPLRVLATGFAPGFVYCGLHAELLHLPRRTEVRARVPAGTVLFAAGQTAITSTPIPTGWHVIGQTDFRNFDPARDPPTTLAPGDEIVFKAVRR
jgi:KipI family sensor histidine kinase inhibitor